MIGKREGRGFEALLRHHCDNMKIAFFTETYHPQINGVVKVIDVYEKELEKRGHKVYIFAPKPGKSNKKVFRFRSLKFKPYPEYRISLPSRRLMKKIKEIDPDIIHTHGPITAGLMALSVAKLFNKPIVVTYHTHLSEYTDYLSKRAKKIGKKITRRYVRWFHNRADSITTPSKPIKKELRSYGIRKPIHVITTGLDIKIKSQKIKKKNKIPIILHVGRICKEKEIDIILKEFKKLGKGKLIITSKGPDENRLKKLVKKLKIKNVKFTGYISDRQRDKLYKTADVFVCASSTETQGLVALEAMAYGCPVIVRDARGFKDVVENNKNGLLFKKNTDLNKKIQKMLNNENLRKKIIKNGYKTAKKFSIERTIDQAEKIYKKLI